MSSIVNDKRFVDTVMICETPARSDQGKDARITLRRATIDFLFPYN